MNLDTSYEYLVQNLVWRFFELFWRLFTPTVPMWGHVAIIKKVTCAQITQELNLRRSMCVTVPFLIFHFETLFLRHCVSKTQKKICSMKCKFCILIHILYVCGCEISHFEIFFYWKVKAFIVIIIRPAQSVSYTHLTLPTIYSV